MFKRGESNINYKEVIIEDTLTRKRRVVPLGEVPGITGGSKEGIRKALKKGNKYKGRYLLKYIEREER